MDYNKLINNFTVSPAIVILIIFTNSIYAQERDTADADKKISLTGRIGYHSDFEKDVDEGFIGGLSFDFKITAHLGNNFYAGLTYDYWKAVDYSYFVRGSNEFIEKKYKGSGVSFTAEKFFLIKNFGFYIGGGIGIYSINHSSKYGSNTNNYFNLYFKTGIDFKVFSVIYLSSEISYYSLANYDKSVKIVNYKIGPKILLTFK